MRLLSVPANAISTVSLPRTLRPRVRTSDSRRGSRRVLAGTASPPASARTDDTRSSAASRTILETALAQSISIAAVPANVAFGRFGSNSSLYDTGLTPSCTPPPTARPIFRFGLPLRRPGRAGRAARPARGLRLRKGGGGGGWRC